MALTTNVNALLQGQKPQLEIAAWAADYGATTFYDLGLLTEVEFDREISINKTESGNVLFPVGAYLTGASASLKGKIQEFDLKNIARLSGQSADGSDVTVVPRTENVSDGTITWGFGAAESSVVYLTARLTLWTPRLVYPWGGNAGADVYTKAEILIPKCLAKTKSSESFKKNSSWEMPFELEAFYDDSVTTEAYRLFKVVLTAPK